MYLPGHGGHTPVFLRGVQNLLVQTQQIGGMRRLRRVDGIFMKLLKQDPEKIFDDQFTVGGGKIRFPGQKPEQTVAVFRVRYRKGNSFQRKAGDKPLVTRKTDPVIFVRSTAGAVVDLLPGGV